MTTATFYAENRNNNELTLFQNVSLGKIQKGITKDGKNSFLLMTARDNGREVLCLIPGMKYEQFIKNYILTPVGTWLSHVDFRGVQKDKHKLPMYFVYRQDVYEPAAQS